jgi:hypothetical protein
MRTLIAMALVCSGCGGCSSAVAVPGHGKSDAVSQQEFKVAAKPQLVVESDAGNVALVTGAAGTVRVEVDRQADSEERARKLEVTTGVDGNTVKVQFHKSRAPVSGVDVDNEQVSFRITAPADARLEIHTRAGNVDARGFAGGVQIETGGGKVSVEDAAGALSLRSGGGEIIARRVSGNLDAVTNGGAVRVEGTLSGKSRVQTGGGTVAVAIPATSKLGVTASTGGGSVSNEFGLPIEGGVGPKSFRGTIGDGSGGSLELHTGGGSITLAKLKTP